MTPRTGGWEWPRTPAQLQIDQRISQAAVRRSNESLDLLDPVRTSGAQDDAPGWGTPQIRDAR